MGYKLLYEVYIFIRFRSLVLHNYYFQSLNRIDMIKLVFPVVLITLVSHLAYSQGCSDAGFCTMGAMKPDQAYSKKINFKLRALEISQYRGKTTLSPVIYVSNIDFAFSLNQKTSFQVKLPYQSVSGNLGKTFGIGDISLSATRNVYSSEKFDINATIGTKIPTNDSDLKKQGDEFGSDGNHYPMYYQISLGSYDFIAGISLISKKWLFAAGYQNALTSNNNQFRWEEWPEYPSASYLQGHDLAVELKRGTDVMFRVERNWRFSNYNFSFGMLPIYRITKDQINLTGTHEKVDKTTGLALTGLFSAGYHFNVNSSVKFIFGLKFVDRDVNPDQLTRNNVQTIAYVYRF